MTTRRRRRDASSNSDGDDGMFEELDEKILAHLVSPTAANEDGGGGGVVQKESLEALIQRLDEDADAAHVESFWKAISDSVTSLGFAVAWETTTTTTTSAAPPPPPPQQQRRPSFDDDTIQPAAFQTESGKKHLRATASLLRISKVRAARLTLSALRQATTTTTAAASTTTNNSSSNDASSLHLDALLGTRHLLNLVVQHHFRQRLARLKILMECLCLEQDTTTTNNIDSSTTITLVVTDFLDQLDGRILLKSHHQQQQQRHRRGLFHRLVYVACAALEPSTRDELLPALHLRGNLEPYNYNNNNNNEAFVSASLEAMRQQARQEQQQALEALVALLYRRLDRGVHRVDYALLLCALESRGWWWKHPSSSRRSRHDRHHLAGMLCAECTTLWMCTTTTNATTTTSQDEERNESSSSCWLMKHPLLEGIPFLPAVVPDRTTTTTTPASPTMLLTAEQELEVLKRLLYRYAAEAVAMDKGTAPESLALLAFGLLLRLAHQSMTSFQGESMPSLLGQKLSTLSQECIEFANGDCHAFENLQTTLTAMLRPSRASSRVLLAAAPPPYDWQFSSTGAPLFLEEPDSSIDLRSMDVAYASVGIEFVSASIAAFRSFIMREGAVCSPKNITGLCDMTAIIYGNHPALCETFWQVLDSYVQGSDIVSANHAVAFLLEAAHKCASSALHHASRNSQGFDFEEAVLPALAPLLHLASSLCSSPAHVLSVLDMLPAGTIRTALLCCNPPGYVSHWDGFQTSVLTTLESLNSLAAVGTSEECQTCLCYELEQKQQENQIPDGPRLLYEIILKHSDASISKNVLHLFSFFLRGSSETKAWELSALQFFAPIGNTQSGLAGFLADPNNDVSFGGVLVLNRLVDNLLGVVFWKQNSEHTVLEVMKRVGKGVEAACDALSNSFFATSNNPQAQSPVSYRLAHGVLRALNGLFDCIRPIMFLHLSPAVRFAALEIRESLLRTLASSAPLGQAIAYFACAPVSLSIGVLLEKELAGSQVLSLASKEHAREGEAKDCGAWSNLLHHSGEGRTEDWVQALLEKIFSGSRTLDLDMQELYARGWADDAVASGPLRAARSALQVLRSWALHVEDIVVQGLKNDGKRSMDREAAAELERWGPLNLFFSQAIVPPPIRQSHALGSVWPTDTISVLNLMTQYLCNELTLDDVVDGPSDIMSPAGAAKDAICLCIAHAQRVENVTKTRIPAVARTFGASFFSSKAGSFKSVTERKQLEEHLSTLNLLCTLVDTDVASVSNALVETEETIFDEIAGAVHDLASSMKNGGNGYFEGLRKDRTALIELRIADASLAVLASLWEAVYTHSPQHTGEAGALDRALDEFCTGKTIISDVVAIVSHYAQCTKLPRSLSKTDSIIPHVSAVLNTAVAKSLDLLACEAIMKRGTERTLEALVRLLLLPSKNLASMDAVVPTAKATEELQVLGEFARVDDTSTLLWAFPTVYCSGFKDKWSRSSISDVSAVVSWLDSFIAAHNMEETIGAYKDLNGACSLLSSQLSRILSWGSFAKTICHEKSLPIEAAVSLFSEVSDDLARNLALVEECKMEMTENFLAPESAVAGNSLSGVLLVLQDSIVARTSGISPNDNNFGVAKLEQLRAICEKSISVSFTNDSPNVGFNFFVVSRPFGLGSDALGADINIMNGRLQQTLLLIAIKSIALLPPTETTSVLDDVLVGFARIACKGLSLVECLMKSSGGSKNSSDHQYASQELLRTCISLLTVLVTSRYTSKKSQARGRMFFSNLSTCFRKTDTIPALVHLGQLSSKRAMEQKSAPAHCVNEKELAIVQAILSFLSSLAEVGDFSPEIRGLLRTGGVSHLIVSNPLLIDAGQRWSERESDDSGGMGGLPDWRGYVPLGVLHGVAGEKADGLIKTVVVPFLSGRDDPVHELWRNAFHLIRGLLIPNAPLSSDIWSEDGDHFFRVACDFLTMHGSAILMCLKKCCSFSVGMKSTLSTSQSTSALTFNVLREASEILSLVSALCSKTYLHHFEKACPVLKDTFIEASKVLLSAMSKFLGVAGAARELFSALAESEKIAASSEVDGWDELSTFNPVLASGIPQAKHEAIRNAHSAVRCCAFITAEDFESVSNQGAGNTDNRAGRSQCSTASLEQECQSSMNGPFMIKMEGAAALILSYAVSILWSTHPASSCFTLIQAGDAERSNLMSLVTPGMNVAIFAETQPPTENADRSRELQFARILQIDTVRCMLYVRYLGGSTNGSEGNVPVARLAGLEDMSKRRTLFAHVPAQDSASELEASMSARPPCSVGDLLLTLRWCYQCTTGGETKYTRRLLAESTSILLGAEVALHRETTSPLEPKYTKKINAQLLALFNDIDGERPGNLKSVLSEPVWKGIRGQLQMELDSALKDQMAGRNLEEQQDGAFASVPGLSMYQRSARKSPFRGLGMTLRHSSSSSLS